MTEEESKKLIQSHDEALDKIHDFLCDYIRKYGNPSFDFNKFHTKLNTEFVRNDKISELKSIQITYSLNLELLESRPFDLKFYDYLFLEMVRGTSHFEIFVNKNCHVDNQSYINYSIVFKSIYFEVKDIEKFVLEQIGIYDSYLLHYLNKEALKV